VSVGHVARGLESAGIATTTIMVEAFRHRAEQMMIPRTVITRFPMGRPLGAPNDVERHLDVMRMAFGLLDTATEAGTIISYPDPYRTRPSETRNQKSVIRNP
jgi:hypothetical protein